MDNSYINKEYISKGNNLLECKKYTINIPIFNISSHIIIKPYDYNIIINKDRNDIYKNHHFSHMVQYKHLMDSINKHNHKYESRR